MLAPMAAAMIATITPRDATVGKCHQCDTIILIPTNTRMARVPASVDGLIRSMRPVNLRSVTATAPRLDHA